MQCHPLMEQRAPSLPEDLVEGSALPFAVKHSHEEMASGGLHDKVG